jgi:hypothetical protein
MSAYTQKDTREMSPYQASGRREMSAYNPPPFPCHVPSHPMGYPHPLNGLRLIVTFERYTHSVTPDGYSWRLCVGV